MKNRKKLIIAILYISWDLLMIRAFEYNNEDCSAKEACYLQIGDKLIECNLTENKDFPQFALFDNISMHSITDLKRDYFENNESNSLWVSVSGEYNFSAITYPANFLIILNRIREPRHGNYYFLTFTDEILVPKGKQVFNIRCLRTDKKQNDCISIMYLTGMGNLPLTSLDLIVDKQTIPVCNKRAVNLDYLEEDKTLKITVEMDFHIKNNYSIDLWKTTDKSNCYGKLIRHAIKTQNQEFLISKILEEGLYCIKFLMDNGFKEQRFFSLEDLKRNKCIGENQLKPWIPKIDVNQVVDKLEVTISPTNVCGILVDIILFRFKNSSSDCKTDDKYRVATVYNKIIQYQESFSEIFENLINGNYCVIVYPKHNACEGLCKGFRTAAKSLELLSKNTVTAISPMLSDGTQFLSLTKKILIALACMCGLLAALSIFYFTCTKDSYFHKRKQMFSMCEDHYIDVESHLQIISCKLPKKRLLLLCAFENDEMDDIILHFINVLENCFFCKVINCFNDQETNEIIKKTPSGWILYNIHLADKIILIESQRTYQMQQHWINSKITDLNSEEDCIFLSGLITIQNKQCHYDYSQVSVVRFNFTSSSVKLEDVVETCRYILPSSLPNLFLNIHRESLIADSDTTINKTTKIKADALLEFWVKECPTYNTFLEACYRMEPTFSDILSCHHQL